MLTYVTLSGNQCINETFFGASAIAALQKTVTEKCSFDEPEDNSVRTSLINHECSQAQDFTSFANIKLRDIEAKTSEVINKLDELKAQQKEECGNIARALEAQTMAQTKALEVQAKALEAQTKTLEAQAKTLKEQTAEIVDVKMQIMLKMNEIERLNEELQRKNEEVIRNREKIKKLEEKVEIMTVNF